MLRPPTIANLPAPYRRVLGDPTLRALIRLLLTLVSLPPSHRHTLAMRHCPHQAKNRPCQHPPATSHRIRGLYRTIVQAEPRRLHTIIRQRIRPHKVRLLFDKTPTIMLSRHLSSLTRRHPSRLLLCPALNPHNLQRMEACPISCTTAVLLARC